MFTIITIILYVCHSLQLYIPNISLNLLNAVSDGSDCWPWEFCLLGTLRMLRVHEKATNVSNKPPTCIANHFRTQRINAISKERLSRLNTTHTHHPNNLHIPSPANIKIRGDFLGLFWFQLLCSLLLYLSSS